MLRILVVDDHALMRDAVRLVLDGTAGFEIAGEADTGRQALRLAEEVEPDLVVLDLGLPDVDGLVCLDELRRSRPGMHVVVFSGTDDPQTIATALARGVDAYILKAIDPIDLPAVLRQVVAPTVFHRTSIDAEAASAALLSPKERAVLEQLALGHSNREIARTLWISDQTVKFHLRNIYRKLGASTRTEALRIAHERALVAA